MLGLITILGLITFAVLIIGLGVGAGGLILILLVKMIIPVVVLWAVFKIAIRFLEELGGRH